MTAGGAPHADAPSRGDGTGEWVAIAVTAAGLALLWPRGLGALTLAGAVPLVAAFAQLGAACRLAARGDAAWARGTCRLLWRLTPALLVPLPGAVAVRALGGGDVARAGPDLWLGAGMYVIAVFELVEVVVRRLDAARATERDDDPDVEPTR